MAYRVWRQETQDGETTAVIQKLFNAKPSTIAREVALHQKRYSTSVTFHENQFAMVVKIRLARFGKRNLPFYNIVVAHARYVSPPAFIASLTPYETC